MFLGTILLTRAFRVQVDVRWGEQSWDGVSDHPYTYTSTTSRVDLYAHTLQGLSFYSISVLPPILARYRVQIVNARMTVAKSLHARASWTAINRGTINRTQETRVTKSCPASRQPPVRLGSQLLVGLLVQSDVPIHTPVPGTILSCSGGYCIYCIQKAVKIYYSTPE